MCVYFGRRTFLFFHKKKGVKHMNPFKSNNIVAKVLQVYAYLNAAAGFVLTLLLNKELDLGAVAVSIILATVLVVNFFIFALGEVIDLLQNLKDNTGKKAEIPDELPDL